MISATALAAWAAAGTEMSVLQLRAAEAREITSLVIFLTFQG
jgi:hypothetical protein